MSGMANVHEHEHGICPICGFFYSVCKGQHQCQECGRKDAEIGRLKELINQMGKSLNAQDVELDAKDAEIERLKAKVSELLVEIGRHCKTMDNQQQLVTELCDALKRRLHLVIGDRKDQEALQKDSELIQRAREATHGR